MLYNVLPPLAFFLSLGGIILVVSRVVSRIRREEWEADVKRQSEGVKTAAKKLADLAAFIGPNQKGVRTFKNRIALVLHGLKKSATGTVAFFRNVPAVTSAYRARRKQARRDRRLEKTEKKQAGTPIRPPRSVVRERVSSLNARRKKTMRSWRERWETRRKETQSAPEVPAQPSPAPAHRQERRERPRTRLEDQTKPAVNISKLFHKEKKKIPLTPLAKARAACKQRDYAQAEDILIPHLMKDPRDTKAYMLLGLIATKRKAWEEAVEIYDQVVKIDAGTPGAWAALGRAAHEGGKITRAIEALQRAHDADPTNIDTIQRLLTIARRMDNTAMQNTLIEQLKELSVN